MDGWIQEIGGRIWHRWGLKELCPTQKWENRKEEEDRLTSLLPFEMQLVTCEGSKVNESVYQIERKTRRTHTQKKENGLTFFQRNEIAKQNDNKTNIIHNIILQTRIHE